MDFSGYVYLIPAAAALILAAVYMIQKQKFSRMNRGRSMLRQVLSRVSGVLLPGRQTRIYKVYARFLRFTGVGVEDFFKAKYILFMLVMVLCVLVKYTNISLYTKDILGKYQYRVDLIYRVNAVVDENQALNQELGYFYETLESVKSKAIGESTKEQVEDIIKNLITIDDERLYQPRETIANKIYYRVYDYYKYRELNILLYILMSLCVSFLIELGVVIYNFFAKAEAGRELRFLKKLIILNGSIKPVDFMKVIKVLIEKSKYHRKAMLDIEEMNKKNSVGNREIYFSLIREAKEIDTKLFYEKLDQANNYDFDQAIINIENEFKMEKRAHLREIRRKIEYIHAAGILGFIVLILILVLYLIMPWLREYNMGQMY